MRVELILLDVDMCVCGCGSGSVVFVGKCVGGTEFGLNSTLPLLRLVCLCVFVFSHDHHW